MRQNATNVAVFCVLAGASVVLWWYASTRWFPQQDKPPQTPAQKAADQAAKPAARPAADVLGAVVGAAASRPTPPPAPKVEPKAPPQPSAPPQYPTLIALGTDKFNNQVLLTTRGGGVQQVLVPGFFEANRLGREVEVNGKRVPLALIPGVRLPRRVTPESLKLEQEYNPPELVAGKVTDPVTLDRLAEPSYTLFHYAKPDDNYPDSFLGTTNWKVVDPATNKAEPAAGDGSKYVKVLDAGTLQVAFEAELPAPHLIRIRKTFTLAPKDYHIGLRVEFERLGGAKKGEGAVRFQFAGPRGLPVEGEWYTPTTRTALIGWETPKGANKRQYEDAATITLQRGGDRVSRADTTFKYAAVSTQYFTSGLAVDKDKDAADVVDRPWEYVRATSELYPLALPADEIKRLDEVARDPTADPAAKADAANRLERNRQLLANVRLPELDDITVRAVTDPIDLAAGGKLVHNYAVYNGPTKVMLLKYVTGDHAADPAVVDTKYLGTFGLRTLTDYHSPTWFSREILDRFWWTDLVIFFTNVMHRFLWNVHAVVGSWGWSIIVLTVLVRLLLFFPSRKQTAVSMRMVELNKKLKPELDKLHEKYKDDLQTYNREKTRLMLQNGMNPFAMMGGCFLLLAQSPMIAGLYFCLQESVFFRLNEFLWVPNLAAPDMTVKWGEDVPVISDPAGRYGSLSFLYLGPYLNILPLIAVGLMLYQQIKMMPPPTDEQMAAQQRMMKVMMIFMAVMFYKSPAGLAMYFIVTTLWGILERQLIPKPKIDPDSLGAKPVPKAGSPNGQVEPAKPKGFLGRLAARARERMEELQKQAEEQASRQAKNPYRTGAEPIKNPDRPNPDRRGPPDRKKKKRK